MLGKKPTRWTEVEDYVVGLRALLAGDELEWDGAVIGLRHGRLSGVTLPVPVEIRVAAHGPKGYAVAERAADGMVTNPTHHTANTGPASNSRSLVQYYGTVLEPGEDYTSERVIDATGPYAAFQLHIGAQGMASDTDEAAAFRRHIDALDAARRHLEVHRGHLIEVTDAERPLMTPRLLREATGSGTGEEVRGRIEAIRDSGVQGILYGLDGPRHPERARSLRRRRRPASGGGLSAERALDRLAGEPQAEALDKPGDAVGVHLEAVARAQVGQRLRLGLRDAAEVDEFGEEPLEAAGR